MKKTGLLNQPLSSVIAGMGHTDSLVIADAGLPIPDNTQRIDLAVTDGIPAFLDVLQAVLHELQVESAVVATELETKQREMYQSLTKLLGGIPIETAPHEQFKARTKMAKAIARTGEFTPYANIILISGVVF